MTAVKDKTREGGFTLVEICVGMVIIALVIAAILKGGEMIRVAHLNGTIEQARSYVAATRTFYDKYKDLPGDILAARDRVPECTASIQCENGNGNGVIGTADRIWLTGPSTIGSENLQFWKHLALADMISGVNATATTVAVGQSSPAAKIGGNGVFGVATGSSVAGSTDIGQLVGLFIRLQGCLTCANLETPIGAQPLTTSDAEYIDRKMDDGIPMEGLVRTTSSGASTRTSARGAGGGCEGREYDTSQTQRRCIQHYEVGY